jgi:ATP-binding protein involved in chromosome partitioning
MFLMMTVPMLGIIENMSGLICPHCGERIEVFKTGGGVNAAKDLDVPFLGAIPLDVEIGRLGDIGQTFTKNETPAAKAFDKVVDAILVRLNGSDVSSRHQNL